MVHATIILHAARSGMSASGKFTIITNEQVISLVNTVEKGCPTKREKAFVTTPKGISCSIIFA